MLIRVKSGQVRQRLVIHSKDVEETRSVNAAGDTQDATFLCASKMSLQNHSGGGCSGGGKKQKNVSLFKVHIRI